MLRWASVPARSRVVARSIVLLAATLLVAPAARADRTSDAEDLFRRAKGLIAQNKHVEACPLLEESYRLERARGTLLNLALCHEQIGKTSAAWGEFRRVEQEERASGAANESRVQLAREHADKLQPRVSRLKIVVPPDARAPGLVVKVDGESKGEPLWAGVPVDPGTRSVEVSATNKKPLVMKVKVDDEGVLVSVTIPVLADAPVEAPPAAAAGANLEELEEYASNRARRTTGFVIGGIGLATLAVGAAFGVGAIINDNDAKKCSPCTRGTAEASASDQSTDRAYVFANIANVTVPLGALGSIVGAYLVLSAGPSRKVAVVPVTSAHSAGLSMTGEW
jgi:hypothetical protein